VRLIVLPKVGHGFSVQRRWMPKFRKAFLDLGSCRNEQVPPSDYSLHSLPLVKVTAPPWAPVSHDLALLLTGGGWAGLDRNIAGGLPGAGVPVVRLNSLKYFWAPWDAATTACDDVLPFVVERLPADLQQQVALMTLLGPDLTASFEFHALDWMGLSADSSEPIRPVLEHCMVLPRLCINGAEEKHNLCGIATLDWGNNIIREEKWKAWRDND
jgi:type IV secretory pathway VirJ component